MKRVLTAIALIIITGIAIYLRNLNNIWFGIFATFIGLVCVTELINAFKNYLNTVLKIIALALSVLILPAYEFFGLIGVTALVVIAFISSLTIMTFTPSMKIDSIAIFSFILFYPIIIIALMLDLSYRVNGLLPLLMIFLICPFADTMAFFVGSLVGGKKLCPKISPKKTISGFFGGVFGGVCAAVLISILFNHGVFKITANIPSLLAMIVIGLLGSVVTVVGDLAESSLKRRLEIKDFGKFLPGHGGMLDRVDSILYNTVYIFIVFTYIVPII